MDKNLCRSSLNSVAYCVALIVSGSINHLRNGPLTVTLAVIDRWIATLEYSIPSTPVLATVIQEALPDVCTTYFQDSISNFALVAPNGKSEKHPAGANRL